MRGSIYSHGKLAPGASEVIPPTYSAVNVGQTGASVGACARPLRAAIYVRVRERAGGRGELGFIGAYDSPRIATIIHLELLFRRWFEAQGDTPVRIARGLTSRLRTPLERAANRLGILVWSGMDMAAVGFFDGFALKSSKS